MCGICGIVDFESKPVQKDIVHRMNDLLWHRGPDDAGYHFEAGVGLGHRRLSIIDLESGRQPLANENETVWVVFNGEIYNYRELRSKLLIKGHTFRTNSDTEVIVHLYEEEGENCFCLLQGMFSIVLWDRQQRKLLMARDRIGKKPLFYFYAGSTIVFGSELKAVAAGINSTPSIDFTSVADYFTFLYIPSPKSIYNEIRKVPAAHYMIFSSNGSRQQAYWDLSFANVEQKSEEAWCEQIRTTLMDGVDARLVSDVPLGSFLSGGVDSSAVVACMAKLQRGSVLTCAVGFEEEQYSETKYAKTVAEHLGSEYFQTLVRPDAVAVVENLSWHYDEPFADSSAIPTYYVSKAARERVTVALSGDGGDESFAGYKRYIHDSDDNRFRSLIPHSLRRNVVAPFAQAYPELEWAPRPLRVKNLLHRLSQDPLEGYLARISVPGSLRDSLLSDDLKNEIRGYDPYQHFREHYNRADTGDLLSRIQYLDIKTYLTDDICVKVDRASMAVSLEVRAPLLDYRLLELAARIPSRLKLKNASGKYILKQAVRDFFPAGFLDRPKQGFGVPVAEWFRKELRDWAEDVLFVPDGLLNLVYLRKIWERHQSAAQDYSAILWGVFMFRQWQKTFGARQSMLEQSVTEPRWLNYRTGLRAN